MNEVSPELLAAGERALTAATRVWDAAGAERVDVTSKGRQDPVTALDRAMEAAIRDALGPDATVLGEESEPPSDLSGDVWVVDPLDGTFNYVHRMRPCAVSIGLLRDGAPLAAWVRDLTADETFRAARGAGATLNGVSLGTATWSDAAFGLSSDSLAHPDYCVAVNRTFGKIRSIGSQALMLCWVAAGRLAANVNLNARLWDDAAGALLVTEAGGVYRGADGAPVFPLDPGDARFRGAAFPSAACAGDASDALDTVTRHLTGS